MQNDSFPNYMVNGETDDDSSTLFLSFKFDAGDFRSFYISKGLVNCLTALIRGLMVFGIELNFFVENWPAGAASKVLVFLYVLNSCYGVF